MLSGDFYIVVVRNQEQSFGFFPLRRITTGRSPPAIASPYHALLGIWLMYRG